MQCYKCTECNLTFDARKKLKKSTREQHKGKFVISTERKSPITEYKTNIKKYNSNKEEFKEQATADGVEINVMIVTKDILKKMPDHLTQTEQDNEQLKSGIKKWIEFKKYG